jgi:hypothetical protein
MQRAFYSNSVALFLQDTPEQILGILAERNQFDLVPTQRNAWQTEIKILRQALAPFPDGHILIEYSIPRMGKRVDAILLTRGLVLVIEFKVGDIEYTTSALDQVMDYALDLKNFHEASHSLPLVPVLVATDAKSIHNVHEHYQDWIYETLRANRTNLASVLIRATQNIQGRVFDAETWIRSPYKPTPTIIEAAQALYRGHTVQEISRSEAAGDYLQRTTDVVLRIIHQSKTKHEKSICFVTGVPGAGKTLIGLNVANSHMRVEEDEYAVFLSGNGPLVEVLREALARDEVERSKLKGEPKTKSNALRNAKAFIQNVHHFRDEALDTENALTGKVVIFDEAQRAWTQKQTAAFMKQKRGLPNFDNSEPEFLVSVMDRHSDWAVIICLVGGGQEINTGEAGLMEWFVALGKFFPHWNVFVSPQLTDYEYLQGNRVQDVITENQLTFFDDLHLGVSNRSFRSEQVSAFIKAILDLDVERAQMLLKAVTPNYPIVVTRNLATARRWLKKQARGTERYGFVASSGGIRLRPIGIDVKSSIEVANWFLNDKDDVRSSYSLEQVATEFDIQGLELDWTAVAWDADLRLRDGEWEYRDFSGTSWQKIKTEERKMYLKNAYRVLLTRARQGMVIFVPHGDAMDKTRLPEFYDETFAYLRMIGLQEI